MAFQESAFTVDIGGRITPPAEESYKLFLGQSISLNRQIDNVMDQKGLY